MNKFKVGDKVTLKEDFSSIYLKHNKEYVVDKVFDDKLLVQGVDFKYDSKILDLVKESNMNKFKVGDKVVRVSETYGKAIKGGVYEVSGVSDKAHLGCYGINLKGHDGVSGKFNYEASCFDLYDDNILSPLEAADAILHKEPLQEFCEHTGEWFDFYCSLKGITLDMLQNTKFRRKPKTVVINGVEVVAPAKKDDIEQYFYTVNFSENTVHTVDKVYIDKGFNYYWTTKEDAQKALDAMLIPFNELNRGEQQ